MKNVVAEIETEVGKRAVKQVKENFDVAQKNIMIAKKMLSFGIPIIVISLITGISIIAIKAIKKREQMKSSGMYDLAKQFFAEITFLPVPPQPLSFILKADKTAILNLANQITDKDAIISSYKILYNRDFVVDMRKALDDEYQKFEDVFNTKQTESFDANDYTTNTKAASGDCIATIKDTVLYSEKSIKDILAYNQPLTNAFDKTSVSAKRIIKNAEFTGLRRSVPKFVGNNLLKEGLCEIIISKGLFNEKTAIFYVKNSDVKIAPKKDIKALNYVEFEIDEFRLK